MRRYFKFSLFNVIIFYAQLDRNTNFLEPNINAYLKGFLPKIPLEKFDFFYKFHGQYVKNKKNSDQLGPLEQEITNFFQAQDKTKVCTVG